MTNWSQDFTVKSNARRAAKKQGIDTSKVVAFVKAGKTLYRFPLNAQPAAGSKEQKAKQKQAAADGFAASRPDKPKAAKISNSTGYIAGSAKNWRRAKKAPKGAKPSKPKAVKTPVSKADRGLKFTAVAALLRREGGASITEVCKAAGWLPHSARARISVDVSKLLAKGEVIVRRREEGVSHYSIIKDGEQLDLPGVAKDAA